MKIVLIFLVVFLYFNQTNCTNSNKKLNNNESNGQNERAETRINLTEKATKEIRLSSVLSLDNESSNHSSLIKQKIIWTFKRVYSIPNLNDELFAGAKNKNTISIIKSTSEDSLFKDVTIALDNEVSELYIDKYKMITNSNDLVITNLTYADTGVYSCRLWNKKTIFYNLVVTSQITKPIIKIVINDQLNNANVVAKATPTISEMSSITVSCLSKYAYPYPSVLWFMNNRQIIFNDNNDSQNLIDIMSISNRLVEKETNTIESSLTVKNISSSLNSNNITCKLIQIPTADELSTYENDKNIANQNEQLWQTSDAINLNIAFKPIVSIQIIHQSQKNKPLFLTSINNYKLYLYERSDVTFKCNYLANPIENSKVTWIVNNVNLNAKEIGDELEWKKLNEMPNKVNLTCSVTNAIGVSAITTEIEVLYAPKLKINEDKEIFIVNEFEQLKLNCSADASPQSFKTQWIKFNDDEKEDFKYIANSSILEFKSLKHNDNSGIYGCLSLNEMQDSFGIKQSGKSLKKIEINVKFKPQMNVISKKVAANFLLPNKQQTISCLTMSNPIPKFQWYKDGVKLDSETSDKKYQFSSIRSKSKNLYESSLIINDLRMDHDVYKVYECEAINELGSNRVQIELVPLSRPDMPTELRVVFVNFMTISLAWSPGFDGGLDQSFLIEINDKQVELTNQIISLDNFKLVKYGESHLNISQLNYNSVYKIRLISKNKMGLSEWTDYIHVKTLNLSQNDAIMLPKFKELYYNVPKNRLEFTFVHSENQSSLQPQICFNITTNRFDDRQTYTFKDCVESLNNPSGLLLFDNLDAEHLQLINMNGQSSITSHATTFKPKQVKSIRVQICFKANSQVCSLISNSAIIDTYNKLSPWSKLSGNKNGLKELLTDDIKNLISSISSSNSSNNSPAIPIALIIGICVCILTLLILLFTTIVYCIRKRNFKLCKALLSNELNNNNGSNGSVNSNGTLKQTIEEQEKSKALSALKNEIERKLSQNNKSTLNNIDISSISAPLSYNGMSLSVNGNINQHYPPNPIMTNSMNSLGASSHQIISANNNTSTTKRTFTTALTTTANNIIGKHKMSLNEQNIMVTEDDEQQQNIFKNLNLINLTNQQLHQHQDDLNNHKSSDSSASSTSSTTVLSNCSSLLANANNPIHSNAYNSGASMTTCSASNSDPVAINNSLSSNSTHTTDSPTYGYNVAAGATSLTYNQMQQMKNELNHYEDDDKDLYCIKSNQQLKYNLDESNNYILTSNTNTAKTSNLYSNYTKNSINQSQQHQQHQNNSSNSYLEQSESGYSTPSRHKKVVYEVIV